jgi:Lipase (class 3)
MQVLTPSNYNDYVVTAMALSNIAYNVVDSIGNVAVNFPPFDIKPELISPAVLAAQTTSASEYNPAAPNYDSSYFAPNTPIATEVVWGPAYLSGLIVGDISLMYIAKSTNTNEYFVVIRGTSYISLKSWLTEDLSVYAVVPMNLLNSALPMDDSVTISQAAYTGMSNLLALIPPVGSPGSTQTAVQFLQGVLTDSPDAYIYVTGHSLGGALTPVMFAYLNAILFNGSTTCNMAMWSFAGPTAGGQNFNDLIDSLNPNGSFLWRIQNSLDVVPLMFTSTDDGIPADVSGIYTSNGNNLPMDTGSTKVFTQLFQYANETWTGSFDPPRLMGISMPSVVGGGVAPGTGYYSQPATGNAVIDGGFQSNPPSVTGITAEWALEAAFQHHSANYYPLTVQNFPISSSK